jgi:sialic acid synthase SpsE
MRLKDLTDEPYIIAEIGSNWRKCENMEMNLQSALYQISRAKGMGADAVKFQLFTHQELYGVPGDDTYSLPAEWIPQLSERAHSCDLDFGCTAFSVEGYRYVDEFVDFHKVASSHAGHPGIMDLFNDVLDNRPHFVSNGMFECKDLWCQSIEMDCASKYPAEVWDYMFDHSALSDHTLGYDLALIYRTGGCQYFEKHVDLDLSIKTPDSCVSINDHEFKTYCELIRDMEPRSQDKVREEARRKWGVVETENGWFRPWPTP